METTANEGALLQASCVKTKTQESTMDDIAISHAFIDGSIVQRKKSTTNKTLLPARVQLGVMAFFMFLVTQMIRSNLYIARVGMMQNENATNESQINKITWDEQETGMVLSAFYWSYWITELPGGLLAQRFGGCRVLGFSVLLAGLVNLAFPLACKAHYGLAAILRAVQGLALGVTWPATHALSAHWIPSIERSKFMTTYHENCLFYRVCSWNSTNISSKWASNGCSGLGICFLCDWWSYNFLSSLLKTPWISILKSGPFWAVLLASQGLMWGTITLSMQLPAYFKSVHMLDIKTNGFVSGIPELCKFGFSIIFSTLMDYILRKEYLTITSVRKISVATSEFLPAVLLLVLAFLSKESAIVAVVLLAAASAVGGASSSGSLPNIVDLSPNFAGTLLGIIKTLTLIPGVLSPNAVSLLVNSFGPVNCWFYIFISMAVIYLTCGTIFVLLGSGEVQAWNQPQFKELSTTVENEASVTNCEPNDNNSETFPKI
ncbi:sialin-like isoform X3 [Periplaneta americana]|uniref:sialin-like isoform X3 n=1 Tax=Periplaneta americana TaxID=6978 RepID=UPI0037E7820A